MNNSTDRSFGDRQQELLEALPNIRRFALSLSANMADADDLLQLTVERLLSRGLPSDAPLLPYSMTVCRNIWIDELRSRRVRLATVDSENLDADDLPAGELQAINELRLREVQAELNKLPEEHRAVLELVTVEQFSYKEAADILDVPIGTVMSRLARARAALAYRLGQ